MKANFFYVWPRWFWILSILGGHPFVDVPFHIQFSRVGFTFKKLQWNSFMWDVCAFNFNHICPTISHIFLSKNILGWYHQELPQRMVKEPKTTNHFLGPFILNDNYEFFFFSCSSIARTNIQFEVYFGILKNRNC